MDNIQPGISRFRNLSGGWRFLTRLLLSAIPVVGCFFMLDIPFYLGWAIMKEQYFGIFLALVLGCIFLVVPPTRGTARERVPWYDVILSVLGFGVGLYVALFYPRILERLGVITPDIEKEFILFKGVNVEEIFGREKDFLLRIKGCHTYTSSFVKVEISG